MIDLELLVPVGRSAPSVARQALEPARSLLMPDQMNEATVLVSELVTDAVRRADPDPDERIRVRMNVRLHEIRVEVGQSVPQTSSLERRGPLDAEATRDEDWGLRIVGRIADRWGVDNEGATTWFELGSQPPGPEPEWRQLRGG